MVPNCHYIEIKPDHSDLLGRIEYYNNHIDKAKQIIRNANEHVRQFRNKHREEMIRFLFLKNTLKRPGRRLSNRTTGITGRSSNRNHP